MSSGPIVSDLPKTSGIYAIRNTTNDKRYIGSAVNLRHRWNTHRSELRADEDHHNIHLQRAWNLYGEESFEFLVIDKCSIGLLLIREQLHMNLHPDSYNIAPIAGSCLGVKHTPETRAKNSAAKMGNTYRRGHKDTLEARANMSAAHMGVSHTPERNAKKSANMMGNTYRLGHKDTDETRAKKSVSHMGNTNAAGHVPSPESRAKNSAAHKGSKRTPEARANMSAAQTARWAREREARDAAT